MKKKQKPKNGKVKFDYSLKERVDLVASATGEAVDRIEVVRLQLNALRDSGLLVDATVSGMSLGVCSASMGDFGIADADERLKRLRGGQKLYFREEYYKELRSVESSYRQLLNRFSYKAIGVMSESSWRYVTFKAWQEWRDEAKLLEERFDVIRKKIISDYARMREEFESDQRSMLTRAWSAIKSGNYDGIAINGKIYRKPIEFVDDLTAKSLVKFPTKDRIEKHLFISYRTAVVATGADFEADKAREEIERTKVEKERAKQNLARSTANAKIDETRLKAEGIKKAEYERRMKELESMRSPFEEISNELRGRVREAAESMLESIKKNGALRGKVAEQVKNLGEIYRAMAITEDKNVERVLEQLQNLVGDVGKSRPKDAPDRDIDKIRATMLELVEVTKQRASAAMNEDRASMLEFDEA